MFIKCLYVLFCSMLPIIELRGGIPLGISIGLGYPLTIALAIIGNLIPIPFLILFGGKLLRYFAKFPRFGKPFRWLLQRGERKAAKITTALFYGLWLFVAIPLPGTGAWTGALIAITLDLKLKDSLPAIMLGVVTAAAIMVVLALGFDVVLWK